ncbi:hypothetical protein RRG08_060644, partial [Elysia crispata]
MLLSSRNNVISRNSGLDAIASLPGNAWSQESLSSPARRPVYCNVESMCYSPLSHSLTAVKRARCEVRDLSRHPSHSG